jgi:hypothetical protein
MSVTHPSPLTPAVPATPSSHDLPPLPDDVRAFCDRHELVPYVAATARMLREAFPTPGAIETFLFTDPESDSENPVSWVVVRIRSRGAVPELLQSYERFLDRWVTATPAPIRDLLHGSYTPA